MLIDYNPDDYEVIIKHDTCEYHKLHSEDTTWPGCTCFSSYCNKRKEKDEGKD